LAILSNGGRKAITSLYSNLFSTFPWGRYYVFA